MSRGAQAQGKEWYVYVHTGLLALARLKQAAAHHEVAQSISEELSIYLSMLLLSMAPAVF